ncbi:unnamed protein product [Dovyalis caffra]|uniref:F-box domain-containing protein n=1 Tax=Dovyalis caffra TaxID=77055 RepID=A0AAV1RMY3_9ROSI|nr:unnamed protein product [Dovyalis caffra]
MVRPVTESSLWSKRENQIAVSIMKKSAVQTRSSYNLDVSKVTQLVDCRALSWIWEEKVKRSRNNSLCSSWCISSNDYISRIPDDVLVSILSRLTFREAARTSVVSRRWRCLWTFYPGLLDFDASRTVLEIKHKSTEERESILPIEQCKFVNSVNQALKQYQGLSVDELKICFDVDQYKREIDSWIHFAKEKHVKRFRLDLSCTKGPFGAYSFPLQSRSSSSFNSLIALHLISVEVTGKVIEHLLSNSPLLEVLHVERSSCLGNLKVSSSSLKLTYLTLAYNRVESVEISAKNLVSFKYHGKKTTISLKDVPRLIEVSVGGPYCDHLLKDKLLDFSSYLSQLEKLSLCRGFKTFDDYLNFLEFQINGGILMQNFSGLNSLKKMQLTLDAFDEEGLLYCQSLIEASPSLHRLSLQLRPRPKAMFGEITWRSIGGRKHQCLKVVKIVGFMGLPCNLELALDLVKYAVSLQKLIIDPRKLFWLGEELSPIEDVKELEAARSHARKLQSELPSQVELEIL